MNSTPSLFMPIVAFQTFGCKLNQSETASLVREFEERGYRVASPGEPADVFVINTCTVTGRTDAKCRQTIRQVLRHSPETTVVVTGCYSQVAAEEISRIPGVDYVLGNPEKYDLFSYLQSPGKQSAPVIQVSSVEGQDAVSRSGRFIGQTRAFLKIQDGCDRRCAYCIVPFARGPSRSVNPSKIVEQAKDLVDQGFRELVLTGVHIGMYGKEIGDGSSIVRLLENLLRIEGLGRLRLSSLDPEDISSDLLDFVADSEKICRHFHLPLQSGSDTVLKRMRRRYTTLEFRKCVDAICTKLESVGLGGDIIVGFPGETDDEFDETYLFVESLPFTYLHVFPYSVRDGTEAASMTGQVPSRMQLERAKQMRMLGHLKRQEFMKRWIGETVTVLMESKNLDGWMAGLSSEYLRVKMPFDESVVNRMVDVGVDGVLEDAVTGYRV